MGKPIICSEHLQHGAPVLGENGMFIGMHQPESRCTIEMFNVGILDS